MFHYLTVATVKHPILDLLQKTIEAKGEKLTILGLSINKKIGWEANGNLGLKLKLVCEFMNDPNLNKDDIVLFVDAYDVLLYGDKETIIERYNEFEKPLVFGAEMDCSPDDNNIQSRYPAFSKNYTTRYLNSGLCIGSVEAFRDCFKGYVYVDQINDQYWWKEKFLERQDIIELDYTNKLFLNCHGVDKNNIIIENNIVKFNHSNPLFLHFNGTSKAIMNKYAKLDPNPYFLFAGATKESYKRYGGE